MTQAYELLNDNHVLTMGEITHLTEDGGKPADTLMNVVALIAERFKTDVCSAYLLEPDRSNLVLAATLGLHPRCIGDCACRSTKASPAWSPNGWCRSPST